MLTNHNIILISHFVSTVKIFIFNGNKFQNMENKFRSLTVFEFQKLFHNDDACLEYLSDLKWRDGFVCPKCGHTIYCRGKRKHDRQCTSCHRSTTPSSGTLFNKVKFSILKAFYIVYYISTSKKKISSTELSRKLGLQQKTCWLFRRKTMKAMESSSNFKKREERVVGRKNKKKKLIDFAIERKGKGISRMYGKVIKQSSAKELGAFMKANIDLSANVKTEKWQGYKPLIKDFPNLTQVESGKKGGKFPDLHRAIMGFKGWLRGIHPKVDHLAVIYR